MKKRGEVWWVSFDPSIGTEIKKTRPAVIISNNLSNRIVGQLQVIPFSSKVPPKIRMGEVKIVFNEQDTVAKINQLTTVSEKRLVSKAGVLAPQHLAAIERNIIIHLRLSKDKKK